jgi:hypothetical protein
MAVPLVSSSFSLDEIGYFTKLRSKFLRGFRITNRGCYVIGYLFEGRISMPRTHDVVQTQLAIQKLHSKVPTETLPEGPQVRIPLALPYT